MDLEQFTINGSQFLAFVNSRKDTDRYNTESFMYKMNNFTGKFSFYQTINTIGVEDMEHFTIADKYYLAVDNFQSHLRGYRTQLFISRTDKSLLFFKTLQLD